MNINFYPQNSTKLRSSIDCIIRYKGKRFKIATGISAELNYWDKKKHRASFSKDYPDAETINIRLEDFDQKIRKIFLHHAKEGTTPTDKELIDATTEKLDIKVNTYGFLNFFKNYYLEADISEKTKSNYKNTENLIEKYQNHFKLELTFDDVNMNFYTSFKKYILTTKKNDEGDHYSTNYFGTMIKHIKTVMRHAGPEGAKLHQSVEYKNINFIKSEETADSIYLNVDELKKIKAVVFTPENAADDERKLDETQAAETIEKLKVIRNLFLIGCYTALRISDFSRLSKNNITGNYIRIKPLKGIRKNDDVVIPIHPEIASIVAEGIKLPKSRTTNVINKAIRKICRLAGITEPITTVRTEGGRQVTRTQEKWKLVASHTCRRSGATNMYLAGIPSISIMKITGHKTERSFLKYIRITQEENARLLAAHPFFKS